MKGMSPLFRAFVSSLYTFALDTKAFVSTTLRIVAGKHPMVDTGLQEHGRLFTANDCTVGAEENILLITGYVTQQSAHLVLLLIYKDLIWQARARFSGRTRSSQSLRKQVVLSLLHTPR